MGSHNLSEEEVVVVVVVVVMAIVVVVVVVVVVVMAIVVVDGNASVIPLFLVMKRTGMRTSSLFSNEQELNYVRLGMMNNRPPTR